jgi:hypothetical protein
MQMLRSLAAGTGVGVLVLTGLLSYSSAGRAQQTVDPETQAKILKGFQIAPVPLNMGLLDPNLVGLGSYLVNTGGCNDCHSPDPSVTYTPTGNPYFGQHTTVNPAVYLGGGQDFGAFPDPAGPFPHIISRNLTPDASGLPEGGNSYQTFLTILRTGVDTDHVHPTCAGAPNGNCLPPPFDGDLLQIMPWPGFSNLTDHDILAIYTYLSAVPCVEGGPGEPPNRCKQGAQTFASAKPKNATVTAQSIQLDGTGSKSADGKPLSYAWTIAPGSLSAPIFGSNTATPTVLFGVTHGTYTFRLTVTDSTGNSATDFATVNFTGS